MYTNKVMNPWTDKYFAIYPFENEYNLFKLSCEVYLEMASQPQYESSLFITTFIRANWILIHYLNHFHHLSNITRTRRKMQTRTYSRIYAHDIHIQNSCCVVKKIQRFYRPHSIDSAKLNSNSISSSISYPELLVFHSFGEHMPQLRVGLYTVRIHALIYTESTKFAACRWQRWVGLCFHAISSDRCANP